MFPTINSTLARLYHKPFKYFVGGLNIEPNIGIFFSFFHKKSVDPQKLVWLSR
jgi:hypothetical protein